MILHHRPGYGVASSLVGAAALGLLIFLATAYYTYTVTPEFTAQATLQFKHVEPVQSPFVCSDIVEPVPLAFTLAGLQSIAVSSDLVEAVADRFDDEEYRLAFVAPYAAVTVDIYDVLESNCTVILHPEAKQITFHYTHPDAAQAARVANFFVNEMSNYFVKLDIEKSMYVLEKLRIRTNKQRDNVEDIKGRLAEADEADAPDLRDKLEINESLYRAMVNRLQTENFGGVRLIEVPFRVIEKAVPPSTPSSPNVARNLLLGAAPLPLLLLLAFFRHQRQ